MVQLVPTFLLSNRKIDLMTWGIRKWITEGAASILCRGMSWSCFVLAEMIICINDEHLAPWWSKTVVFDRKRLSEITDDGRSGPALWTSNRLPGLSERLRGAVRRMIHFDSRPRHRILIGIVKLLCSDQL